MAKKTTFILKISLPSLQLFNVEFHIYITENKRKWKLQ